MRADTIPTAKTVLPDIPLDSRMPPVKAPKADTNPYLANVAAACGHDEELIDALVTGRLSTLPSGDALVQMHAEGRSEAMYAALDALERLDKEDRAAVYRAMKCGADLPIRQRLERYRKDLGRTIGGSA